jgi:hypothetical protein
LELVGERVRVLGFEHLLDLPASDFKVLLNKERIYVSLVSVCSVRSRLCA